MILLSSLHTHSLLGQTTNRDFEMDVTMINIVGFVLPAAIWAVKEQPYNAHILAALVILIGGGAAIGSSLVKTTFGILNTNIFHYALGAFAILIGKGLNPDMRMPWASLVGSS